MSEPGDFPERAMNAAQSLFRKGAEVARQQTRGVRLQSQIAKELRMKRTPELKFVYDETVDRGMRINELLEGGE